jgi:hypothetical protein
VATPYFDVDRDDDLARLPRSLRQDLDTLGRVARRAERDVLQAFTLPPRGGAFAHHWPGAPFGVVAHPPAGGAPSYGAPHQVGRAGALVDVGGGHAVHLRGYALDAAAADPALRDALAEVIAEVIAYRMPMQGRDMSVQGTQSSRESSGVSYKADADPRGFPAHTWAETLRPWDLRPPVHST